MFPRGSVIVLKSGRTSSIAIVRSTSSNRTSDSYQYLQKSIIPSYHFQKSLRRLPIPKLEHSCERYLAAVEAICSDADLQTAKQTVDDLLKGDGRNLQQELVQYDNQNKHTSYISQPWFDMYLESRLPCPVNFNPFMMLAPDSRPHYNDQLTRATQFVISCARFKKSLDANLLEPEVYHINPAVSDTEFFRKFCRILPESVSFFGAAALKAFPLDMSQYPSLFGGNRIPHKGKDKLHRAEKPRHVLVMRNGALYAVEVFDKEGNIRAPEDIHAALHKILNESKQPAADRCIGSLTTMERDQWADARQQLISRSANNLKNLQLVDDALFCLCLDSEGIEKPSDAALHLLCGADGRNRWFDKCFQLIVDSRGQATINFEHSWGDGVAVLRLIEETYRDTRTNSWVSPNQPPVESAPDDVKLLDFDLDDSLRATIANAQKAHTSIGNSIQFSTVEYPQMNRDSIKESRLSPDSVMQLAIQLAYHRLHGQFATTYESSSTAAFKKGRTECIRSATIATRDAVRAVEQKASKEELMKLFRKSSSTHGKLVKEAAMGQGFDRHLLGLKITANRLQRPLPALFSCPVYKKMGHFVLSTSTLSTETIVFGGFGPVVADGLGIGYNVDSQRLGAVISTFKGRQDADKFSEHLVESLDLIRKTISPEEKKSSQ